MAHKVAKYSIEREKSWLYFLRRNNKTGFFNVWRIKMKRAGDRLFKETGPEIVKHTIVKPENNYLYFLDSNGDISRFKRKDYRQ